MAGKKGRSGRPSIYTEEIADSICERLKQGESLRKICADEGMPSDATVREWALKREGFSSKYAEARQIGYSALAEEILDIADDSSSDTYLDKDGNEKTNSEVVARSRLRVDTRKWILSKVLPKIYGDKVAVGGAEDLPPIKTDAGPEDVARRIAFLLASGLVAKESAPADPGNSTSNSIQQE